MKRTLSLILSLLLALSLPLSALAEGEADGGTDGDAAAKAVSSITLRPTTLTLSGANTTGELQILVSPDDASDLTVNWTSSNPEIATVTATTTTAAATITVTGLRPGKAAISGASKATPGVKTAMDCAVEVSGINLIDDTGSIRPLTELSLLVNGSTKINIDPYGAAGSVAENNWNWSSSNSAVLRVVGIGKSAQLIGLEAGTATVTCQYGDAYKATCDVTVNKNTAAAIERSLTGGTLRFSSLSSEIAGKCRTLTGEPLSYVTNLSVPTGQGTLYDRYVSEADTGFGVATSERYTYGGAGVYQLDNITFVPKPGAPETVEITYTGYSTGSKQFSGTIIVTIGSQTSSSSLSYSSRDGELIRFSASDFMSYSQTVNNRALRYVTFTPPGSRYGTLYYRYVDADIYGSAVSSGTRYFPSSSPSLDDVTFVPADGYDGAFTLSFTGCDTEGSTFRGSVRITVSNASGTGSTGSSGRSGTRLYYEMASGERLYFRPADFTELCYEETGAQLDSIYFTSTPSSSRGTLYYDRTTQVYTYDSYYRTGSASTRLLEDVSFLAKDDYEGTFTISFRGYSTENDRFSGTIEITVSGSGGSARLNYTVRPGARVYFRAGDFSELCRDRTGGTLNYVRFTSLPSASRGTLYYDTTSRVTTSANYYRTGSSSTRLLEDVSFLAGDSFSGSVSIPFYGYDVDGDRFSGSVTITASGTSASSSSSSTRSTYTYYYTNGAPVYLRSSDITSAASPALGAVDTIRLQPQDSTVGRFVMDYVSPGQYSAVDPTKDYSFSALSRIAFLPKAGFSGPATITYLAKNRQGTAYGSKLEIQVSPNTRSAYFTDMEGRAWAVPAVDFFRSYNILNGATATTYDPSGQARRGAFVAVLGRIFSFPNYYGTYSFDDVDQTRFFAPALAAARGLGVVPETGEGAFFRPDDAITRQDAAVFLYRCLVRQGRSGVGGAYDLARFSDRDQVADYAVEAMGALVRMGVFAGDSAGRLTPTATLTRAQMAVILYRAVT